MCMQPQTRTVTPFMLDRNNQHIIDKAAAEAEKYAMLREIFENARQARATTILIHHEFVLYRESSGQIGKLTIQDNGSGMSAEDLLKFFRALGSSGRLVGKDTNFGTGAKIIALPKNKYGIDFLSYVDGEAHLIRLSAGQDGNYGIYTFKDQDGNPLNTLVPGVLDEGDMDETPYLPRGLADEYRRDHGTVVILHGNSREENTFKPNGEDSPLVWLRYLQARYWRIPENMKVQVYGPSLDLSTWATIQEDCFDRGGKGHHCRTMKGAKYYAEMYVAKDQGWEPPQWVRGPGTGNDALVDLRGLPSGR